MDKNYIKVEGDQFVKDRRNSALLATNKNLILQNEARKKLAANINSKNEEINNLKLKVETISNDMEEIKSMLRTLLVKKD